MNNLRHDFPIPSKFVSRKDEIALVIMDMMMPVMDGANAIRNLKPDVKIIASSGITFENGFLSDSGIFGFLEKPYTTEKLLTEIAKALQEEKKGKTS